MGTQHEERRKLQQISSCFVVRKDTIQHLPLEKAQSISQWTGDLTEFFEQNAGLVQTEEFGASFTSTEDIGPVCIVLDAKVSLEFTTSESFVSFREKKNGRVSMWLPKKREYKG